MTRRRFSAPMLYAPKTARWLRVLVAAIDHAAAGLCWQQWQHGLTPRLQPAPARNRAIKDPARRIYDRT